MARAGTSWVVHAQNPRLDPQHHRNQGWEFTQDHSELQGSLSVSKQQVQTSFRVKLSIVVCVSSPSIQEVEAERSEISRPASAI